MVEQNPKRSGEPPVWLMFGAGGTVSAIFFPVIILILGLLLPFGLIDPHNLITFAYSWIGKLIILVLTIFPMWCGLHRIHHAMHDLKIHVPAGGFIFYGLATIYTEKKKKRRRKDAKKTPHTFFLNFSFISIRSENIYSKNNFI